MTPLPLQFLVLVLASWLSRHQQELIEHLQEEKRVLREQLGGKRLRFTDSQRRGPARKAKRLGRRRLRDFSTIVTPDTLLRWDRQLAATKHDGSSKRATGRPRIDDEIQRLTVRLALDNLRWGYTRIRGALMNLGYEVSRNTIKLVLPENGIETAGSRSIARTGRAHVQKATTASAKK